MYITYMYKHTVLFYSLCFGLAKQQIFFLKKQFVARLLRKFSTLLQNPLNHYRFYHSPSLALILSKKNRHPVSLTLSLLTGYKVCPGLVFSFYISRWYRIVVLPRFYLFCKFPLTQNYHNAVIIFLCSTLWILKSIWAIMYSCYKKVSKTCFAKS